MVRVRLQRKTLSAVLIVVVVVIILLFLGFWVINTSHKSYEDYAGSNEDAYYSNIGKDSYDYEIRNQVDEDNAVVDGIKEFLGYNSYDISDITDIHYYDTYYGTEKTVDIYSVTVNNEELLVGYDGDSFSIVTE